MPEAFYVEQDGPITIHIFSESSDSAIDTWAAEVARVIENTPPDQPFLLLLDVSARQVSFTRYARQKTLDLFGRYQHRQGRFAFLFSSKIAPYYARIFFASIGKLGFECEFFSNRDRAKTWLTGKFV